jgi:hypothetical protein
MHIWLSPLLLVSLPWTVCLCSLQQVAYMHSHALVILVHCPILAHPRWPLDGLRDVRLLDAAGKR